MSNPMAQSEPVEQRFGAPAQESPAAEVPTRQIDGTDVIEQGTLAAENVLEALKDVIDPELTDVIERQAQTILSGVTDEVQINWVWMPPWGPDRITPDGREQLRAIGFNV